MAEYLGKQLLEVDPRKPDLDPKKVAAIDLQEESIALEAKSERNGAIPLAELKGVKLRMLMEMTQRLWADKKGFEADFPHAALEANLGRSGIPLFTIFIDLEAYLRKKTNDMRQKLLMEPDLNLALVLADIGVRHEKVLGGYQEVDIFQHFHEGLVAGTIFCLQLAQLMHRVYEKQYQRKMNTEEMEAALRSHPFLNTAVSLGMSGSVAEHVFIQQVRRRSPQDLAHFDPGQFEIINRAGLSILRMKAEAGIKLKKGSSEMEARGVKGTCPALHVKGEEQSVLREYAAWLSEVLCRHYVPLVCEVQCPPSVG